MIIFENLNREEKEEAIYLYGYTDDDRRRIISTKLAGVLRILDGNMKAHHMAWSLPVGNYLINEPKEIAEYLILKAKEDA